MNGKPDATNKKTDDDYSWLNDRKEKKTMTKSPLCGLNAYPGRFIDYTILFYTILGQQEKHSTTLHDHFLKFVIGDK